jgi:hypothetical protein
MPNRLLRRALALLILAAILVTNRLATYSPTREPIPIILLPTLSAVNVPSATASLIDAVTPAGLTDLPINDLGIIPVTPPPQLRTPTDINSIGLEQIILLPENVKQNILNIYASGQTQGRNPRAFSKLGDSIIEPPHFLTRFESGPYELGNWADLQPAIDYFHGSFSRNSMAVRRGLHSWSVFDTMWANAPCLPSEGPLACEFRLHNPSILLIRLGSNDVGVPDMFDRSMRRIIEFSINNGIIPVLITKGDRHEGSNINNELLYRAATDYQIPVIDFDRVAPTLPRRGTDLDGIHLLSYYAHDYTSPIAFQRGHAVHNLTALIMLDRIWRVISS